MNINIVCIGKLKEAYWRNACSEYVKRLGAYCNVNITELKETRLVGDSEKAERAVIESEGKEILAKLDAAIKGGASKNIASKCGTSKTVANKNSDIFIIALDVKGKKLSSEALAKKMSDLALDGKSHICFLIGGSLGLSDDVLRRADYRLSFSDMTFPHQMMRVILLEQVYRAFKINRGETYHK
ncbi:MAG: 23S rRNA (pseudouridine(1915)-N(3))-methyltransferase RlmH [Firmicutes bacterium]|nr:23S rRNA (pseudouridine(1915)-N(3))-methyltransferase RlmH [Bacillota bacterium]